MYESKPNFAPKEHHVMTYHHHHDHDHQNIGPHELHIFLNYDFKCISGSDKTENSNWYMRSNLGPVAQSV